MKRSFLMSALVLAMASSLAVTACGGGGGSGEPAKDGDSAKKDGEEGSSSGDPIEELQKVTDGIQKDVDAVLQPIKDFDATLDSLAKLPADLKAAKSKADGKKILASFKVLLDGKDVDLVALKIDEAGGGIVKERMDKVKALIDNTKDLDNRVKDLVTRITDGVPKIVTSSGKAMAKLEVTLKNPLAGGDAKKKAEEDKKKISDIVDGFKKKAEEWQKLLTELPPKAKEFPTKLGKAFGGAK